MSDQKSDQSKTGEESTWGLKEYVKVAVFGGVATIVAVKLGIHAIGFTAAGVAARSIAAVIQSVVYGGAVASTSIFAVLQSVGAAGMGGKATVFLFLAGAAVAVYYIHSLSFSFAPILNLI